MSDGSPPPSSIALGYPTRARPEAFAWMALAAVLFALMNFFARLASAHADWMVVAAVRAGVGAVVAWTVARVRGVSPFVRAGRAMWLRSVFGTLSMAATFYALSSRYLPLSDAVTLNNTTPIMVALLAPLLIGERAGRRVLIAVPAAVAGVVLVIRPTFLFGEAQRSAHFAHPASVSHSDALVPSLIALAGALASAVAMISLRRASRRETPEAVALHFSLVAFVAQGAVALALAPAAPLQAYFPMVVAGACAGGAQVAMTRSYALEPAARVSAVSYLQVVADALLGVFVLHEPLPPRAGTGIALVVGGGLLLALLSARDARRAS